MMDDDDLTGESLIFVDFDLTQYGFRAFDWIYHLKSASHKLFVQTNGEEYFIPDEELDQWLQVYRSNLGRVSNNALIRPSHRRTFSQWSLESKKLI